MASPAGTAGDEPSTAAAAEQDEPKKMCCHPDHGQLCRLINDSLLLYTESQTISLPKEKEKNLLIILSQVSTEIRNWENVYDCHHPQQGLYHSHSGDHHNCSANILSVLVTFLTVESQYVRQSTSNLLVVISNFFAKSDKKWAGFLDLLCVCLKVAISNLVSPLSSSSMSVISDSESDKLSFIFALQGRFEHANWLTVACLIQVLRDILKHLKQDYGGELVKRYVVSVSYCLADISWDFLNDIHACQNSEAHISSKMNALHHGKVGSPKSRFLFLGALIQLFCSLTQQSSLMEAGDGSLNKNLLLDNITSLVPKLLNWCFHKQEDYLFISQYLRHKMLMLMIRLSSQIQWECSTLILWLQLIRTHFEDLLDQPISVGQADIDDCLEGSPFQADVVNVEVHKICIPHLQRQAIFLFLRCSFILISLSKETDLTCSCATSTSILNRELKYAQECYNRKKGGSELSEWLQRQVPLETDSELYLEKSRSFALSFLRLYMDEDDFLFEVLLQLWSLPFPAKQVDYNGKGKALEEIEGDILIHLSNILNPIQLFHLFLAELHYDHQVLLDYLISKDTGVNCVRYLLRCLRTVSNSWNAFVEYSLDEVETSQSSIKKRKVDADSRGKIEPPSEKGSRDNNMRHMAFDNARECLLSLERSVKSLHKKNLFPYNPTALLRSFTRFQEFCHQEEKYHLKIGEMS